MPHKSFLLGLIATFALLTSAVQAQVFIDGRSASDLRISANPGTGAQIETITVAGQPFTTAVRATVNQATDPIWAVQVLTHPSTQAVAAGETVIGSYYIRAEPVNGSKPDVYGFFQKSEGEFEQLVWLGSNPGTAWTKKEFKVVASKDYPAGSLSVSFHLGRTAQVVEIADIQVEKLIPEPGEDVAEPGEAAAPVAAVTNPLDAALVAQLGPSATLIIPGNRPADFSAPGPSPAASKQLVDVDDQAFTQAMRVVTTKAVDPIWDAQITSPSSTQPIKQGDVLFGMIDVRGVSEKESGGGQFTAWLQSPNGGPNGGWTDLRKLDGAPGSQWSRRYFNAVATQDFQAGQVNFVFQLGVIPQTIEVANILLWNLGPDADLEALPKTRLTYAGQEPDAPWRAQAMKRIDEHRKADLVVKVTDAQGQPVKNATVDIELARHAFGFATFLGNSSPALEPSADSDRFRDILFKYHNRLTTPSYGAATWGWPDPETAARYVKIIEWSTGHGFETKAHPVVWSRFDWSPPSWEANKNNPAQLRIEVEDYVTDIMTKLGSLGVIEVDFWNEPTGFTDLDVILTDPALRADLFKLGHSVAPSVRLGINEHTILSAGGLNVAKQDAYAAIIQDLLDRDAPLHAIGMQGHMGEDFTPPTKLWEILDRFAAFGLPLHVTEFDVNTEDQLTQAQYTRDFYLALFAHPAVDSITTWGFWGGDIWIPQAQMWREDWSIKPNGQAFVDLITKTLHTHETVNTDEAGHVTVRGFHGDYAINVTRGGQTAQAETTLAADGRTLTITLK